MILPVSLMRIRIVGGGKKKVGLWIPMILVWPIVIGIMIVLLPIALIVCVASATGRRVIFAGPRILEACWAARGLRVLVTDGENRVEVICM